MFSDKDTQQGLVFIVNMNCRAAYWARLMISLLKIPLKFLYIIHLYEGMFRLHIKCIMFMF